MRQLLILLLVVPFLACRRDKPETGTAASASPYTSDSEERSREDGLEGTNTGSELEAPRLVPALRNQLDLISRGSQINDDNLNAYKNLAQDVVNSMVADLRRVGQADTGDFRALKDSVLEEIGGGAGSEHDMDQSKLPQHAARMRRLIDMYQQTMRGAADRL
jgi:hypothetical protein